MIEIRVIERFKTMNYFPLRFSTAIRLAVLILGAVVITSPGNVAVGQQNLLNNPDFEDGHYLYNNQSSLAVPNSWNLWFAPPEQAKIEDQTDIWGQPETVVWFGGEGSGVPEKEVKEFFRNGDYTLKIFGSWRPVWSTFYTDVSGLTPGQNYTFIVPIYPDLVEKYTDGAPKTFAGANSGEHRLKAETPSGAVVLDSGWFNLEPGEWHEPQLTFTATESTMRLAFEVRGKWGLVNNGWFIDQLQLIATTASVSTGQQPTAAPSTAPTAAPQPTAVPPTAAPQPTAVPPTAVSGPTAMSPAALTAQANAIQATNQAGQAPPTAVPAATEPPAVAQVSSQPIRIAPTRFAIPPADADGKIRYVVQPDDSLVRIATIACGETLQCLEQLKALNNLSTDVIWVGQELVIGPFGDQAEDNTAAQTENLSEDDVQATAQAEADKVAFEATALAEAAQPALDPETGEAAENPNAPTPEPTVAPVVEKAAVGTGNICVVMYDDDNANGIFDAEELAVTNGVVSLINVATNAIVSEHTTTGSTEPYCFTEVPSASYNIISLPPTGYQPTTNTEWQLDLAANSTADLQFGSQVADTVDGDATEITVDGEGRSNLTALLGAFGAVFLLLALGAAGYIVLSNRNTTDEL